MIETRPFLPLLSSADVSIGIRRLTRTTRLPRILRQIQTAQWWRTSRQRWTKRSIRTKQLLTRTQVNYHLTKLIYFLVWIRHESPTINTSRDGLSMRLFLTVSVFGLDCQYFSRYFSFCRQYSRFMSWSISIDRFKFGHGLDWSIPTE